MKQSARVARGLMIFLGAGAGLGCDVQAELPRLNEVKASQVTPEAAMAPITLRLWPDADLAHVSTIGQFFVTAAPGTTPLDHRSVVLVAGSLSDTALRKLASHDITETVEKNRVQSVITAVADDRLTVAPSHPLAAGDYTLAIGSASWKVTVHVDEPNPLLPTLTRRWPTDDVATSGDFAVLCADASWAESWSVAPAPWPLPFAITAGVFDEFSTQLPCVTVVRPSDPLPWAPPPALIAADHTLLALLEPRPLQPKPADTPTTLSACSAPMTTLGPACMEVLDDRIRWQGASEPVLLLVTLDAKTTLHGGEGLPVFRRGLTPATSYSLEVVAIDSQGAKTKARSVISTASVRPHVVINEVLANPLGPEPAGEWVELFNDGTGQVNLAGWSFGDGQNQVALPDHWVPAGGYILLVSKGYSPGAGGDGRPLPETPRLQLASLGRAGISNGGEALFLSNAEGQVVSTFPAVRSPQPGVTTVRKRPDTPDEDATGFGLATNGASPGAPNE